MRRSAKVPTAAVRPTRGTLAVAGHSAFRPSAAHPQLEHDLHAQSLVLAFQASLKLILAAQEAESDCCHGSSPLTQARAFFTRVSILFLGDYFEMQEDINPLP